MTVQYAPNKLRVPSGFNNLLEGLAREVLREQPPNIIQFASDYFKTQLQLRDETVGNGDAGPPEVKDEAPAAEVAAKEEEVKPADDAPKVEETAKTEESPTAVEETKTEEPPKAESPEQQEPAPKLSEEEAATKIQAIVRGKKARDDVKAMKEGGESQPTETSAPATEDSTPAAEDSTPAAEDSTPAAEDPAPVAEAEKTEEAASQEEASPEEQEKAALKIQASFRGMQARKEVEAMKENKQESPKDTPAEAEAETPSGGDAPSES